MGIHTGPKDGDYARYMEFLSSGSQGEPGKVYTSRQAAPSQWSTESEAPPLPDGFTPEPVAINPMVSPGSAQRPGESKGWSLPELDAAMEKSARKRKAQQRAAKASTFPDPTVEGKPVVVLPGQGGAWDARDNAQLSGNTTYQTAGGVPAGVQVVQRIVGVVVMIVAWVTMFNAVSTLVRVATSEYTATHPENYFPSVFLLVFGAILLRISRGLRKSAARPAPSVVTTKTVFTRKT